MNGTPLVGHCHVMYAFEAGFSINLTAAEARLGGASRGSLAAAGRNTAGADFHPRPLTVTEPAPSISLGAWCTLPECTVTLFDFGAISVSFAIPVPGDLGATLPLGRLLLNNATLQAEARRIAESVLRRAGDAVVKPRLSASAEDYVVYALPSAATASLDRATAARLLRAEEGALSEEETTDALAHTVRYSPGDLAIVDWNASLVMDDDPGAALIVLEFANTELAEMRHLDDELDAWLAEAYEVSARHLSRRRPFGSRMARDICRLAELQIDAATLFESVNNALKLYGDQYLARLHQAATRRFHTDDYERSVLRKVETLESIYAKIRDSQAQLRAEILEWIIIGLIAFEVAMSFVR